MNPLRPGSGAEVIAVGGDERRSPSSSSPINGLPWHGVPVKGARRLARTLRKSLCLFLVLATIPFFLLFFYGGAGVQTRVILTVHTSDYDMEFLVPSVNASSTSTSEEQKGFLVRNPGCIIPDFDPFHHTISEYIFTPDNITCEGPPALTSTSGTTLYYHDEVFRSHYDLYLSIYVEEILKSDTTTNPNATSSSPEASPTPPSTGALNVTCCFEVIYRVEQELEDYDGDADNAWEYSESCQPLNASETPILDEGIIVYCRMKEVLVYKNVHLFIQPSKLQPKASNGTLDAEEDARPEGKRQEDAETLSVIIFGTDSVSRLNLRRQMPKTHKYLTETLGAVELLGYNKVADNTFPNMVSVLGDLSADELRKHPCVPENDIYDECDWIWKDFKRNGYVTAFMEDAPWMGMFHYQRIGFVTKPTDYYGRPFVIASEDEIGNTEFEEVNLCQGSQYSMKIVHNYSLEVARAFPDKPYFGLYWTASMSHDDLNLIRHGDLPNLRYLEQLKEMGALNRTAMFFMSDHGMRFGDIRSTYLGMLEERLPYIMLYLPPWFRNKYSKAFQNLLTNTRRLTANYDIYKTLYDLANGRFANLFHVNSKPVNGSRGISLFQEIPRARTCDDAGIPEHYCTCQETREVALDDPVLGKVVEYLKKALNEDLIPYPDCAQFNKVVALTGRVSGYNEQLEPEDKTSEVRSYLVQASLSPGNVVVEATVRYDPRLDLQLAGEVSRINEYRNTSSCIHHDILRKFCVCRDQLPSLQQPPNSTWEQQDLSQTAAPLS